MLAMSEAPEIRVFLFPDAAQLATRDENFDVPQPAVPAVPWGSSGSTWKSRLHSETQADVFTGRIFVLLLFCFPVT